MKTTLTGFSSHNIGIRGKYNRAHKCTQKILQTAPV